MLGFLVVETILFTFFYNYYLLVKKQVKLTFLSSYNHKKDEKMFLPCQAKLY